MIEVSKQIAVCTSSILNAYDARSDVRNTITVLESKLVRLILFKFKNRRRRANANARHTKQTILLVSRTPIVGRPKARRDGFRGLI